MRPGLPDIHTRLGVSLREKKLYDEAILEFKSAKEANPYYGQAWVQLGLTYYIKGRPDLAFDEWEGALKQLPNLKEAKNYLALFKKEE
jgi:tetratricopeptide (TPR) repeat protein